MSDKEMLMRWKNNVERQLKEDKRKLQDLENNKTNDVRRYLFYAELIKHWLSQDGDDLNENIRQRLEYELEFLDSQPSKITKEILDLENSIEHSNFVISKLDTMLD